MNRSAYLLLTVFVAGSVSLGAELTASRLLGPFFGTSILVWAVLIGTVLVYLTLGYFIGGRWADRAPWESHFYQIVAWAGFTIGLVPFVARPILLLAAEGLATFSAGVLIGSLFGVLVLFSVPMLLLGCVSPFAIRLAMRDVKGAGNVAGSIYALSTLGSILGTYLPVLVFIPHLGTRNTFLLFALALLVVSLVGLIRSRARHVAFYALLLALLLGLALLFPGGAVKPAEGALFETESLYNYIRVVQKDSSVILELNEGQAVHSIYTPNRVLSYGVWDYFLLAPYFNADYGAENVRSMALIGSAAGTVAKQYTTVYGPLPIDGAEIDPEIVAVGRRYFAMTEPNFNVYAEDGRYFLKNSPRRYDVVAVDAYRPPYIPFHLTTREFFLEIKAHLTPRGVAVINAGRTARDYSLVNVLASTMKAVFPNVYIIDVPDGYALGNSLVVGTVQPTRLENFAANAARLTHPVLLEVAGRAMGNVREFTETGVVFTDDLAPVEEVVHQIMLGYITGK